MISAVCFEPCIADRFALVATCQGKNAVTIDLMFSRCQGNPTHGAEKCERRRERWVQVRITISTLENVQYHAVFLIVIRVYQLPEEPPPEKLPPPPEKLLPEELLPPELHPPLPPLPDPPMGPIFLMILFPQAVFGKKIFASGRPIA